MLRFTWMIGLCALLAPATAQNSGTVRVGAWIDGRSVLILEGSSATWQHFSFAAPGRRDCHMQAQMEPTYLEGLPWFPSWPDTPDCENRDCAGCLSTTYSSMSATLPSADYSVTLDVNQARGAVGLLELPNLSNNFRTAIVFNDSDFNGVDFYDVEITFAGSNGGSSYCLSAPNSTGLAASIGPIGSTSLTANDMGLMVAGCPAGENGLFFYGRHSSQVPFANGYLCVSPFADGLYRLPVASATTGIGSLERTIDYSSLQQAGLIEPGTTWYFQFWFRDNAGGGHGSNLSNGLRCVFEP